MNSPVWILLELLGSLLRALRRDFAVTPWIDNDFPVEVLARGV
jgi:hypothetical protein